jgi:hypothetical protein
MSAINRNFNFNITIRTVNIGIEKPSPGILH